MLPPRWMKVVAHLATVLLLCAPRARAAERAESPFTYPRLSHAEQFTLPEALSRFEPQLDEIYHLGPGDELTVQVWDHPELSGQHIVGPDGRITLPVAGDLQVAGLNRDAARQKIAARLISLYPDLIVTLRVDRYTSNRVYVLGRVMNPGIVYFDSVPSLLEAITRAGGLPVGGASSDKAKLTRCAVFRGKDQVVWIDLRELLTGNMTLNIRLQPEDLVYIPDSDDQLVYVLGEVRQPGAVRLTPEMTFMDALALAGGPTIDGSVEQMRIIRPSERLSEKVSLDELTEPYPEINYLLEEGDIIYVPRRGIARIDYWISKLNPFATFLLLGTALSQ